MREPGEVTRRKHALECNNSLLRRSGARSPNQESNRLTGSEATGEEVGGGFIHSLTSETEARCDRASKSEEEAPMRPLPRWRHRRLLPMPERPDPA